MGPFDAPKFDPKGREMPDQLSFTETMAELEASQNEQEFNKLDDLISKKNLSDLNKLDSEKIKLFIDTADQNQVFDLYIKMIDINLDDVKHGPKDKKMFEDILKYIELKKGGLEAIRDYAISKELGLEPVFSWTNFIDSGKRIFGADWDGDNISEDISENIDLNEDYDYRGGFSIKPKFEDILPPTNEGKGNKYNIPDSKLFTRDEFIKYFNEKNGERIDKTTEEISNKIDVSRLLKLSAKKLEKNESGDLVMKGSDKKISGDDLSKELMKGKNTIEDIAKLIGISSKELNFVSVYECKTQLNGIISTKINEVWKDLVAAVDANIKVEAYKKELKEIQDKIESKYVNLNIGHIYTKNRYYGENGLDQEKVMNDIKLYKDVKLTLKGKKFLLTVMEILSESNPTKRYNYVVQLQTQLGFTKEGVNGKEKVDGKIGPETWSAIVSKLNKSFDLMNKTGKSIGNPTVNIGTVDFLRFEDDEEG